MEQRFFYFYTELRLNANLFNMYSLMLGTKLIYTSVTFGVNTNLIHRTPSKL